MQKNSKFSLFNIAGTPYLLPFGQGIADHKRGVRINDTGIFIWELLKEDRTEKELLNLYASHYEASDSELPQMEADLRQFLQMLNSYGMLTHDNKTSVKSDTLDCLDISSDCSASEGFEIPSCLADPIVFDIPDDSNDVKRYLSIGGLTLLLSGPKEAFTQEFDAFEIPPESHDPASYDSSHDLNSLHIDQTIDVVSCAPVFLPGGTVLLQNPELVVIQGESHYRFLFPAAANIYEAHLSIDGTDVCYYCRPPYTESLRHDLFHAIRLSFLYLAQLHDMVVLHSASMLYRDRAWLFSGHSGAGKSTHTNLWKELYGVHLINGDLNLLSMEAGHPVVHGLPWCGTSGISDTHSYPLGGIFFVKKAPDNHTELLSGDKAQLFVTQRLISPGWTETLVQKNLDLVSEIAPHILTCRLYCTKDPEAAETCKQTIDDYLDK